MTVISKFIPVDPDNLPDEEVLAIDKFDNVLIGKLKVDLTISNDFVCCTNEDYNGNYSNGLDYVTAYIPVSQLVELYKQGS